MVEWTACGGSRTTVHGTCSADLIASVGQLRSLRYAFGQAGRTRRNVPKDPVRLIVSSLIAGEIQVVHVQEKTLRTSRCVGPTHRRRRTLSRSHTRSGLAKF